MEEKKKGKGLVVVLVLFVLTTIGLALYICYDKGIIFANKTTKETSNNKVDTKTKKELDIDSRLVQSLYNKVKPVSDATWDLGWNYYNKKREIENFYADNGSEEIKMKIVFQNLIEREKKEYYNCEDENIKKIPEEKDGRYSECKLLKVQGKADNVVDQYYYDKDHVERVYKDIFGYEKELDTNVPISADALDVAKYYYISELNQYVLYAIEGGGSSAADLKEKLVKAEKDGENIKIYADWIDTDLNDKSKKDVTKITYTFKLDNDGMYSFVSRVKEK